MRAWGLQQRSRLRRLTARPHARPTRPRSLPAPPASPLQVIRRLLAYPSRPAVMLLHHYAWWESPGDGLHAGLFYRQPEQDLTMLSHYYDLPSLSLRTATWHLQRAGIDRFRASGRAWGAAGWLPCWLPAGWACGSGMRQRNPAAVTQPSPHPSPHPCPCSALQVDRVPMAGRAHKYVAANGSSVWGTIPAEADPQQHPAFFLVDGMHPGDTGHAALAELLAQPLSRAAWEVAAGEALGDGDRRRDTRLQALPPPMIPSSQDETPSLCAMLVRSGRGAMPAPPALPCPALPWCCLPTPTHPPSPPFVCNTGGLQAPRAPAQGLGVCGGAAAGRQLHEAKVGLARHPAGAWVGAPASRLRGGRAAYVRPLLRAALSPCLPLPASCSALQGAWAELEVDSRSAAAHGETQVWLSHLRSYQGMGTARIECKSGCTCTPTLLDGTWNRRASLFWITRLYVRPHAQGGGGGRHRAACARSALLQVGRQCRALLTPPPHPALPRGAGHPPQALPHPGDGGPPAGRVAAGGAQGDAECGDGQPRGASPGWHAGQRPENE